MNIEQPFVIVSAELASASPLENLHATADMARILRERNEAFVKVEGVYKDHREVSFLVLLTAHPIDLHLDSLVSIAEEFGQECVLHVDVNRSAELVYGDGRIEQLQGKFKEMHVSKMDKYDAYTFYKGRYWVVA